MEALSAATTGESRVADGAARPLLVAGVLLADWAVYVGFTLLAIAPLPLVVNLFGSVWAGLFTGALFTLGHDACHLTLSRNRRINLWIGRLCFIPSAHAASLWILGHNRIHHGHTGLRGRDYVWEPLSPDDYRRASAGRRALYRLYRGPLGGLPYYLIEMWWKKNFLPIAPEARREWQRHLFDSAFAVLAAAVLIVAIVVAGLLLAPERSLVQVFALGWLLPFLVWNWLMGVIIYVHHTHPMLPWSADPADWSAAQVAIAKTAEVRLPQPLDFLSNSIMQHNAHHARPDFPYHRLRPLQARLRREAPQIAAYAWTPAAYWRTVRACRLFDYAQRRWVDYDGQPTGPVLG